MGVSARTEASFSGGESSDHSQADAFGQVTSNMEMEIGKGTGSGLGMRKDGREQESPFKKGGQRTHAELRGETRGASGRQKGSRQPCPGCKAFSL